MTELLSIQVVSVLGRAIPATVKYACDKRTVTFVVPILDFEWTGSFGSVVNVTKRYDLKAGETLEVLNQNFGTDERQRDFVGASVNLNGSDS